MSSVAIAACFFVICCISFCLQLPLKIFKSIFMNLINLTMELSLVYLSLFTLIGETTDLSYNQNEILGLVTIIFMLLAQVIVLILMIFEFFYMIYHCIKFCTKKQPSQINDRNELKRKQTTKDGFKNTEEDPDFIAQEYL